MYQPLLYDLVNAKLDDLYRDAEHQRLLDQFGTRRPPLRARLADALRALAERIDSRVPALAEEAPAAA